MSFIVNRAENSGRSRNEFQTSIISGGIIAIFSFALAAGWNQYLYDRDVRYRDAAAIRLVRQEAKDNIETASADQEIIKDELAQIGRSGPSLQPLVSLKVSGWDVIRLNIPKELLDDQTELVKIEEATRLAEEVNGWIQNRQNFRIAEAALTDLDAKVKSYDKELMQNLTAFSAKAREIDRDLNRR